jgi:hypothetical protein
MNVPCAVAYAKKASITEFFRHDGGGGYHLRHPRTIMTRL